MDDRPLLKDLIDIKESVGTSDFVLKLAEAITPEGAERALADYVVTDRLRDNYDQALKLIESAVRSGGSKAAYLHGSFGAGKSHFMAVLYALLSGNPVARARSEFDPVLAAHDWLSTDDRRFLLVPYHRMGAKAIEQRVLGGYVAHVKRLHPQAPTPQVYRTDALFADIRSMRTRMGDPSVIRGLSGESGGAGDDNDENEWGEPFAWTPALLDTALDAEQWPEGVPPEEQDGRTPNLVDPSSPAELRAKLVDDAATNLLPGFAMNAAESEHGFISLDAGLSVIAAHAKSLGYDGLILFLDELILWLATMMHDQRLIAQEAGKITNFVEGGDARRAIPIVSLIARQRDLRELIGEELSGAAEATIQDTLDLAYGRFDTITLEDRNLPQITHARLLQPKSSEADAQIEAAFQQVKRTGPHVWDTLLGSDKATTGADEASFRLTYPFSPAFMDTLVHISSALQRSRTGLKVMSQILADRRDEFRLGELIPLGDLYQMIAQGGDKPFGEGLTVVFDAADKLYRTKLRPYLLGSYELTEDDVERFRRDPATVTDPERRTRCTMFLGDHRLICTLLLSALVPSVPALADLTIRRLGALNHGSVLAPIPGAEVGIIKHKVDEWAGRFGEIKVTGTEANPGVRLELSGIDVDTVIANAAVNDNRHNRRELARRLLAEALGLKTPDGQLIAGTFDLVWRGSNRSVEIVFGNVADDEDLPDHELHPQVDGRWRFVVDLPYDENNYTPVDDVNRMHRLRDRQGEPARTVAWIPTHLSKSRYDDLRLLVKIDRALHDENRFATQYAAHLNPDNRARARNQLEAQRQQLIKQLGVAIRQAYGLAEKKSTDVEVEFGDHLTALPDLDGLTLAIGQPMLDAARHVVGEMLAYQFPEHPNLDPDGTGTAVRTADIRTVFGHIRAAAETHDRRYEIPAKDRALMRRVAEPLGLGQQKEAYFELSTRWADRFRQLARTTGTTGDLSVGTLRDWIDQPRPRGLEDPLANLVVAAFAEMDDRVWVRSGSPLEPAPGPTDIKAHDALRVQPLPSQADWDTARARFEAIFGVKPPTVLRGRMVQQFARQLVDAQREHAEAVADLVQRLEEHAEFLGLDETDERGRLPLARRAHDLLRSLGAAAGVGSGPGSGASSSNTAKKTIEALAHFDLGTVGPERYGTSIKRAGAVADALVRAAWDMIGLAEGQGVQGHAVLESLRGAAGADQQTADLIGALDRARREVADLLKQRQTPPADPGPADGRSVPTIVATPPVEVGEMGEPTDADADAGAGAANADTDANPVGRRRAHRHGGRRTTAGRAAAELQADLAELAAEAPDTVIEVGWRVVEP